MEYPQLESESAAAARAGLLHGVVAAAGHASSLDVLWSWGAAAVVPAPRAMSVDARFDIASLTKVVATAAACGVCIDRGWLDPDAPAIRYLPRLGQLDGQAIRVRDLATHCSGYDNRKFDGLGPAQMLRAAVETPAQWPPQQRFEYSCRNFLVLGRIVEELSGMDLATFCTGAVFAPLGLKDTAFGPLRAGLERVVPTEQPAGTISDGQARTAPRAVGNAGLFSTASDLAAFCRMMLSDGRAGSARVLGDAALSWLTRPCSPAELPRRAFGWDMRSCAENPQRPASLSDAAFGHGGWTGQTLWIDPRAGTYAVVLTNRTHCPGDPGNYDASGRFRARLVELLMAACA